MIDIIPYVAELLAPTGAQIELSYQDTTVTFPLIVLSVPSNMATTNGGVEVFTRITVQIDAYASGKQNVTELAQAIDAIMTPAGFTRSTAMPFTETFAERIMMQYTCVLDYSHQRIITT